MVKRVASSSIAAMVCTAMVLAGLVLCAAPAQAVDYGYTILPGRIGIRTSYLIRPVTGGTQNADTPAFRADLQNVADQLHNATGLTFTLSMGMAAPTTAPGEVSVRIWEMPECDHKPTWLGCTATIPDSRGVVSYAQIDIRPRVLPNGNPKMGTLLHEFGHAMGLDHYNNAVNGRDQMMHDPVNTVDTTYGQGDLNGLAFMAQNGYAGIPTGSLSSASYVGTGVNRIRVTGTATDPNASGAVQVDITEPFTNAVLGSFWANGGAFSGDVTVSWSTVCAIARNVFGTGGRDTNMGCIAADASPYGSFEPGSILRGPNTFDVNGWAIDPNTANPVIVKIKVDNGPDVQVTANALRQDVGDANPGFGPNHAFIYRTPDIGPGDHSVCVTAVNGGEGGDRLLGCHTIVNNGQPIGNLDVGQTLVGPNTFNVGGWAIDPNTAAPISTHVYVDGGAVKDGAVVANQLRGDLVAPYPGFGAAHGFTYGVKFLTGGFHSVCAYGINDEGAGSTNPLLGGCRSFGSNGNPFGSLDPIERVGPDEYRFRGWAIDPNSGGSINTHLYIDGAKVDDRVADATRNDVAQAFPGATTPAPQPGFGPLHGFDLKRMVGPGRHRACAYGINVDVGVNSLLNACLDFGDDGNPFGAFDPLENYGPDTFTVRGWAIDPNTTAPIDVHVYLDGARVAILTANGLRADAGAANPGFGDNHGYSVQIPLTPGVPHTICTYGINAGSVGTNTLIACHPFGASLSNPVGALAVQPNGSTVVQVPATVGRVRVRGWVIDPNTAVAISYRVYVDGVQRGDFVTDLHRADIDTAMPGFASGAHAFDRTIDVGYGTHSVCIYGLNVGASSNDGTQNTTIGCASVNVRGPNPVGSFDTVKRFFGTIDLTGWAVDPNTALPIMVAVYVDGHQVMNPGDPSGNYPTGAPRGDIALAFPEYATSDHGFTVKLLNQGSAAHSICVYAIDVPPNTNDGTQNTTLGCMPT
jgi:hypothetical protein